MFGGVLLQVGWRGCALARVCIGVGEYCDARVHVCDGAHVAQARVRQFGVGVGVGVGLYVSVARCVSLLLLLFTNCIAFPT